MNRQYRVWQCFLAGHITPKAIAAALGEPLDEVRWAVQQLVSKRVIIRTSGVGHQRFYKSGPGDPPCERVTTPRPVKPKIERELVARKSGLNGMGRIALEECWQGVVKAQQSLLSVAES